MAKQAGTDLATTIVGVAVLWLVVDRTAAALGSSPDVGGRGVLWGHERG